MFWIGFISGIVATVAFFAVAAYKNLPPDRW